MVTTKKTSVQNLGLEVWRVDTENLLKEILDNPGCAILAKPLNIFGKILAEVGERAAQINDPELNGLMMRLTIYEVADPDSPKYDRALVDQVLMAARTAKQQRITAAGH